MKNASWNEVSMVFLSIRLSGDSVGVLQVSQHVQILFIFTPVYPCVEAPLSTIKVIFLWKSLFAL